MFPFLNSPLILQLLYSGRRRGLGRWEKDKEDLKEELISFLKLKRMGKRLDIRGVGGEP